MTIDDDVTMEEVSDCFLAELSRESGIDVEGGHRPAADFDPDDFLQAMVNTISAFNYHRLIDAEPARQPADDPAPEDNPDYYDD